jgi:hypothetical protein
MRPVDLFRLDHLGDPMPMRVDAAKLASARLPPMGDADFKADKLTKRAWSDGAAAFYLRRWNGFQFLEPVEDRVNAERFCPGSSSG